MGLVTYLLTIGFGAFVFYVLHKLDESIEENKKRSPNISKKKSSIGETGRDFYCSDEWRNRRKDILMRDGYRCRECGDTGTLHVHHKTPISRGGSKFDGSNLITLCEDCHVDKHPHMT